MESEKTKKARSLCVAARELVDMSAFGGRGLAPEDIYPARELLTMAMLVLEVPEPKPAAKPAAERKRARKKRAIARKVREKFSKPKHPAAGGIIDAL